MSAETQTNEAVFDALWDLVAALANEGVPRTPRAHAAFKVAYDTCQRELRAKWQGTENALPRRTP